MDRETRVRIERLERAVAKIERLAAHVSVRTSAGSGGWDGALIWKADSLAELEALDGPEEGDLGYTRDTGKHYAYTGSWENLSYFDS